MFCSKATGQPVKWVEDRRENYLATIHGRDHITDIEVAARKDGTVTAIRGKTWANLGAYLSTAAPGVPTILHGLMMTGCYTIPNISYEVQGVFTNTVPVDAYRGAGRPEATYLIERMMDLVAERVKMDPAEVRRKNFIPRDKFPYTTAEGLSLRQRQLRAGAHEGARPDRVPAPARVSEAGPEGQPLPRRRAVHVRRDLRPRSVRGRGRRRLPGRPLGERDGADASDREGDRVHRDLAARPGRGDDVRADRRARNWDCRSTTSRSSTATPAPSRWAGARTAAARPWSAARRS